MSTQRPVCVLPIVALLLGQGNKIFLQKPPLTSRALTNKDVKKNLIDRKLLTLFGNPAMVLKKIKSQYPFSSYGRNRIFLTPTSHSLTKIDFKNPINRKLRTFFGYRAMVLKIL